MDIHVGRANAIKLLGQFLNQLNVPFQIAEVNGGSLRNAIPREAEVVLMLKEKDLSKMKSAARKFVANALLEFKTNDPGLVIKTKKLDKKVAKVFSNDLTKRFINSILAMPHGVMAMSPDIPGLVETSTNLATVKMQRSKIIIGTSQRSSIETAKRNITDMVVAVFQLAGAKAVIGDSYPGWQPNMESNLLKIAKGVFKNLFKKNPKIKAIHAGLETGLLGSKYPGLDMISFGPTIQGAHSPDERLNIKDVEKFYNLLKGILKELA